MVVLDGSITIGVLRLYFQPEMDPRMFPLSRCLHFSGDSALSTLRAARGDADGICGHSGYSAGRGRLSSALRAGVGRPNPPTHTARPGIVSFCFPRAKSSPPFVCKRRNELFPAQDQAEATHNERILSGGPAGLDWWETFSFCVGTSLDQETFCESRGIC